MKRNALKEARNESGARVILTYIDTRAIQSEVSIHFSGIGCSVGGFLIINVTLLLVLRKYSHHRSQQDTSWEQQ